MLFILYQSKFSTTHGYCMKMTVLYRTRGKYKQSKERGSEHRIYLRFVLFCMNFNAMLVSTNIILSGGF